MAIDAIVTKVAAKISDFQPAAGSNTLIHTNLLCNILHSKDSAVQI